MQEVGLHEFGKLMAVSVTGHFQKSRILRCAAFALALGVALSIGAPQAGAQVSFDGKTINVLIGSEAGGGTDNTTRLVGTYLQKYLPGNPSMRYRNMPGGHGAKALNFFMNRIEPDGLTWAGGSSSHIDPNSLRKDVVEYNPTQFRYIGGTSRGGSVVFIRKDRLANFTDPTLPPVVVGVLDGNRSWANLITWGKDILNWNVRFVVGYPGTNFILLAVRRGETHMMGTSNLPLLNEMFATGDYVGVAQLGAGGGDAFGRRSGFDEIPAFASLVEGKTSGLQAEAFAFWSKLNEIDKWYSLPPGTPQDIVDAYQLAWSQLVEDEEFLRRARQISEDFRPVSGADVQELAATTAYPKVELVAYMDELRIRNGLPAEPLSDEELDLLARENGLDR
jgi:hypothetical protein